jgi:glutathione synthase/RimK-type ligase-like ATP-grasp enzyme
MDAGGFLERYSLNPVEQKIANAVGLHLQKRKVKIAAVDLIGGYITDFNFTSPGLLRQIEQLYCENLAEPVVRSLLSETDA